MASKGCSPLVFFATLVSGPAGAGLAAGGARGLQDSAGSRGALLEALLRGLRAAQLQGEEGGMPQSWTLKTPVACRSGPTVSGEGGHARILRRDCAPAKQDLARIL